MQRIVFERLGYDEKLMWCDRPEHVGGPPVPGSLESHQ